MKYEKFVQEFQDLLLPDRLDIYNNYCIEYGDGNDVISVFDEEFFDTYFTNPMEVARATYFGNIENWSDGYIRFDVYGNLESLTEYDVLNKIDDYLEDIFEHEDVWDEFITDDGEDEEETD